MTCSRCKKRPAFLKRKLCSVCLAHGRQWKGHRRARRQERLAQGLCSECGVRKHLKGQQQCRKCAAAARERAAACANEVKYSALAARGVACERCGWDEHPEVLEWHHWKFNGKEHRDQVGLRAALRRVIDREDTELVLVCPNCHRYLDHHRITFAPPKRKA